MNIKIQDTNKVFNKHFIESSAFFLQLFGAIPSITWINQISIEKVLAYVTQKFGKQIKAVYQHSEYDHQRKKIIFSDAVVVLDNQCLLELSNTYCEILHTPQNAEFAHQLIKELSRFREADKKSAFEINIIVKGEYGLELKSMEVKKTRLNLELYYEDDFKEVDATIRKRLNTRKDKGIVLLHGLPGTGKTTYLRYLIGRIRKKVIFLSADAASQLANPQLMDLLIDNPDSVLVIEDAENVIKDRRVDDNSSVSNLLNLSDGLLADFLNVQIICTFNSAISTIDSALLRQGRLIARYEFGKLSAAKAQRLSDSLKQNRIIAQPMTIAEITNPNDSPEVGFQPFRIVGFQRPVAS
ncbi:MAG: AAA family ATPase [Cytophagales bacterium]|nr:AAA family ATPase [Cytophagales bacterium]